MQSLTGRQPHAGENGLPVVNVDESACTQGSSRLPGKDGYGRSLYTVRPFAT